MGTHECNYCTLEQIKAYAERLGFVVTIRPHPADGFPGGVDIFVHPVGVEHDNWQVAWLARMPVECRCQRPRWVA